MKSGVPKVEKRIHKKDNKSENVVNYDLDNLYPQRVDDIINASGTATRSVEVYEKFIIGGGFKDQLFYKSVINKKGLTADKLLRKSAKDFSRKGGRAYHVNYNGLLQKQEVSHVPFEYCRIGCEKMKGMIAVYPDWECSDGKRVDPDKIEWYHRYTSDKVILLAQIEQSGGLANYKGQIFYPEKYPLAPIDPVIEDAISDKSIKTFTKKELDNGFNPSIFIRYSKTFDGEEGKEEWEETLDTLREFQGPENTGKIFAASGLNKEDVDLTRIGDSGADKMYDLTEKRVKNSIIQRFGQPPSLVGRRDQSAVFSSQNIEDDTKFYNSATTDERLMFEEDMKELFSNFYIPINETNDYSILEITFNAISTEKPAKISTLGIGGTQALMAVLQSSMGSTEKINTIVLVFGFTTEEAQSMVLPIPAQPVV